MPKTEPSDAVKEEGVLDGLLHGAVFLTSCVALSLLHSPFADRIAIPADRWTVDNLAAHLRLYGIDEDVIRVFVDRKIKGLHVMVWGRCCGADFFQREQSLSSEELFEEVGIKGKLVQLALSEAINAIRGCGKKAPGLCVVLLLVFECSLFVRAILYFTLVAPLFH
jgi:hypothetical protein